MPIDITGKFQPSDHAHGFDLLDAQDIDFTGFTLPTATIPDLSATYLTVAAAAAGYQAKDQDLTDIAGLTRAQGDLILGGASAWTRLAIGSNTFILTSNGTTASWAAPPSAPVSSVFGRTGAVVAAANDYTFAQLASIPTTIAGYGLTTDFNTQGDARWQTKDADLTALAGITVARGSIIVGSVAPAWSALTLSPATVGKFLRSDGSDPSWQLLTSADIPDVSSTYVTLTGTQTITGQKTFALGTTGDGFTILQTSQTTTDKLFAIQSIGGANKVTYTVADGMWLRDGKLTLGVSATSANGIVTLYNGSTGGSVNFYPLASGSGIGNLVVPDLSGTTAFVVTSTNSLSHAGTIPVIGKGGDPPSATQILGVVNRTGQTANIAGPVALTNGAPAGFYLVMCYLECTTTGTGSVALNLSYTDDTGARTELNFTVATMTAGFKGTQARTVYLASGDMTWNVTNYASGTYTLRIRVAYMGA